MAVVLKKLWTAYDLVSEQLPDPRTRSWPFVVKPPVGIAILVLYAVLVLKWGPKWMKNRQPFNLDKILIVYNIVQILACAYIFIEMLVYAWATEYQWVCEPLDFSETPKALNVARFVYHYHLTKYLDLLDTVFFVLRKKFNQVSFLHVFHHIAMVMVSWGALSYLPGGHGAFIGLINTFVHVVMYSYYLLTVIDPAARESAWWKKHITQLQILQLALYCLYISLVMVIPNCAYPAWPAYVVVPNDFFLLCLFVDFYIKTYVKKKPQTKAENKIQQKKTEESSDNVISENDVLRERTLNGSM
ncbi:very long chain fatty acid elongase 1-like [Epargyreus clarus]|uniref:very long chain fatty acid elongase 1-like n=1 Tax=Epargyreus clarus TaxID=520877 RepID=UPI003C2F85B9